MQKFYRHHRIEINWGVKSFEWTIFDTTSKPMSYGYAMVALTTYDALLARLKQIVDERCDFPARPIIPNQEEKDAPPRVRRKTTKPINNLWK